MVNTLMVRNFFNGIFSGNHWNVCGGFTQKGGKIKCSIKLKSCTSLTFYFRHKCHFSPILIAYNFLMVSRLLVLAILKSIISDMF